MSVVLPLPDRPNLTHLRKQAKALLAAWRAGDRQAVARVEEVHPHGRRLIADGRSSLADAQLVVARGYGFASWTRLVRHLRLAPAAQALHTMDGLFQATRALGTVGPVLDRRVELVWQAHLDGRPAAGVLLRAAGGVERFDGAVGLTVDDVRDAIAKEHGFAGWSAVAAHRDRPVDAVFEAAVDAIVAGEVDTLRALLAADTALVLARSPFGHRAALVHYVTANGVESSRQWQSPRNAVEILRTLLRHGADPDAVCDSYGGGSGMTPLVLLVSSVHPAAAGVQAGLVEELCRGGAAPDGPDGDGLPLWTAITYGYAPAVEALARCGARVDNLVFAAAVGDVRRVEEHLDGSRPFAVDGVRVGVRGPLLDADHVVEYALIYSAGLGRHAVVRALLAAAPDLGVIEPVFHSTAAGMARYHRRYDVLALLNVA